jgi:diacylglycerol kinase (ATP)
MRQVWILHNPLAGRPDNAARVERAANALARRGVSVRLEPPAPVERLLQIARAAVAERVDAVLVAGGDGTLGAVAAELAGSPVALGCLPAGTANMWALEIGLPVLRWWLPNALELAALRQLDGQVRQADMGRCNGRLFLLWAGVGLDAFVMEQLGPHRRFARQWGMWYNVAATFLIGRDWHGADLRVTADGREVAGRFLLAVAANIRRYAGLFTMSPHAQPDDGQMELWLYAGSTYAESLAHTGRLFVGRHLGHPGVTCLTSDRFEIYTPAPLALQNDGEPLTPTQHVSIQVVPQALRVLVPPQVSPGLFGRKSA